MASNTTTKASAMFGPPSGRGVLANQMCASSAKGNVANASVLRLKLGRPSLAPMVGSLIR